MNQQTVLGALFGGAVGAGIGWIGGRALVERPRGGPDVAPELGAILGGLALGVVGAAIAAPPATSTAVASNTVIPPAGANGDDATKGGTTLPPPGA